MTPDWKNLIQSDVWLYQVEPWLREFHQDTLFALSECKEEDFKFRQGYARAVIDIMSLPSEMIEADRLAAAQENREDGQRDADRRDWLRVVRRAVGRK